MGNNRVVSFVAGLACCFRKPVKLKAKLWRERTSKVMGQAKPQLEVVRELFKEGRELGLEETGEEKAPPPLIMEETPGGGSARVFRVALGQACRKQMRSGVSPEGGDGLCACPQELDLPPSLVCQLAYSPPPLSNLERFLRLCLTRYLFARLSLRRVLPFTRLCCSSTWGTWVFEVSLWEDGHLTPLIPCTPWSCGPCEGSLSVLTMRCRPSM